MSSAQTLIDRASELCQTPYKLAQRLGETHATISRTRAGKQAMSPRLAAKLATLVGIDPREAALAAVVVEIKDPAQRLETAKLLGIPPEGPDWLHTKP